MTDRSKQSPRSNRRTLIRALAGASLAALAGCGGGGGDETPTQAPTSRPPTETSATTVPPTSEPTDTTTAPPTATIDDLRQTAVAVVHELDEERYEDVYARATDEVAAQVTAEQLGAAWKQQASDKGRMTTVTIDQYGRSGGYDVFLLRATFESGAVRVVLSFTRQEKLAGLQFLPPEGSYSPPDYADPSTFSETDLTLETACGLPAKLSMPNGEGTVPGVVLVHGSGPNDMDETVGPNKPFKDVAWGLASRGVAVLRYDKRTYACDVSGPLTLDDVVVDDALVAIDRLQAHDRVGSTVVVGHSLGAMAAPRIAATAGDLAGAAMLAANARPFVELIVEQTEYLVNLDGTVTEAERAVLEQRRAAVERIQSGSVAADEIVLDAPGSFWNSLAEYDQVETAKSLSIPLYVLQGERDYQVTAEGDFERWKEALGDRKNVSFDLYEDLNHLFMSGSGRPNPNEYSQPGNVAKAVVEDLAEWTNARA
jgi:hypothetical protein